MEIFSTIGYFQKIHFPKNLTISPYFLFIENKRKKEKNLIYYTNFKDYLELRISVSNIPALGKIQGVEGVEEATASFCLVLSKKID